MIMCCCFFKILWLFKDEKNRINLVLTVTFDQLNVSLLNEVNLKKIRIKLSFKKLLTQKVWTVVLVASELMDKDKTPDFDFMGLKMAL